MVGMSEKLSEESVLLIMQSVPCGALLMQCAGGQAGVVNANQNMLDILGYARKDFFARHAENCKSLFSKEDLPQILALFENYDENAQNDSPKLQLKLKKSDGSICHFDSRFSFVNAENYEQPLLLGIFEDISELIEEKHSVEQKNKLISKSKDLLIQELEYERSIKRINAEFYEYIIEADLTNNVLIGKDSASFLSDLGVTEEILIYDECLKIIGEQNIHQNYRKQYYELFNRKNLMKSFDDDQNTVHLQCLATDNDGLSFYWLEITGKVFVHPMTQTLRLITYRRNIDKLKRNEITLLEKAQRDSQTLLYNKRTTETMIEEFFAGSGKHGKHAFMMIDLDNFKKVNDSLGHAFGDKVIIEFSDEMKKAFRSDDILGRIGGDEFLILIKNYGRIDTLKKRIHELCARMIKVYDGRVDKYTVSASLGVSLYPDDGKTYRELQEKADDALYYSKGHGKSTCTFYCAELDSDNTSFFRERDLSELINSSTDGVAKFAFDDGLSLLFFNRKFLELFGYEKSSFANGEKPRTADSLMAEERAAFFGILQEAYAKQQIFNSILHIQSKGGKVLSVRVKGMFTEEKHLEKFPVFYVLFTDVTDLVELNEKLSIQQEKMGIINDMTEDILYEYDPTEHRLSILGKKTEDLMNINSSNIFPSREYLCPADIYAKNEKIILEVFKEKKDDYAESIYLYHNKKGLVPFVLFGKKVNSSIENQKTVIGKLVCKEEEMRQRIELDTNKRMLAGLSRISTLLISSFLGSFEERLQRSLAVLGEILHLDSVSIWRYDRDDNDCFYSIMIYEWTQQIESRRGMIVHDRQFSPELLAEVRDFQMRNMPYIYNKNKMSSACDLEFMNRRGMFSICSMPFFIDGELWGFIDLGSCVSSLNYTDHQIDILKMNSSLLISSIQERLSSC